MEIRSIHVLVFKEFEIRLIKLTMEGTINAHFEKNTQMRIRNELFNYNTLIKIIQMTKLLAL